MWDADPFRLIKTLSAAIAISGRFFADVRRFPSGYSVLFEVDLTDVRRVEGRTKLQLPDSSSPLLQGWLVQAQGY